MIVVGAGIAGLSAAHFLARAGMRVKVLEARERVGGRMTTDHVNGFLLDRGAQFLSSEYGLLLALAAELGLKQSVVHASPWSAVVRAGKMRRLRSGNPFHLLTSGLLTPPAWATFGRCSWQIRRALSSRALNDYSQWASFDHESVSAWANRTLNPAVTEYLLQKTSQNVSERLMLFRAPLTTLPS